MSYLPPPVLYLALVPYEMAQNFVLQVTNVHKAWEQGYTILYLPLFSGNVYATLSRRCSNIGLDHRTETLQYQLESITGTTNIPRREREGQNTVLYDSLDI